MKRTLSLIATISAITSIQPVFAVDYVACREMLRTKNEMIINARDAENNLMYFTRKDSCPDEQFVIHKKMFGVDFAETDYDKMNKCRTEATALFYQTHTPLLQLKESIFFPEQTKPTDKLYSIDGVKWIKASNKVLMDMKKQVALTNKY